MLKNVTPQIAWDHPNQTFKIMPLMMMMMKQVWVQDFQYIQLLQHTHLYWKSIVYNCHQPTLVHILHWHYICDTGLLYYITVPPCLQSMKRAFMHSKSNNPCIISFLH